MYGGRISNKVSYPNMGKNLLSNVSQLVDEQSKDFKGTSCLRRVTTLEDRLEVNFRVYSNWLELTLFTLFRNVNGLIT